MTGRKFDPMHHILVRDPHSVKMGGHTDKPYLLVWMYPVMKNGKMVDVGTRHQKASIDSAIKFAAKHIKHKDRIPMALRNRIRQIYELAKTVECLK